MGIQQSFKALSDPTRRKILQVLQKRGAMEAGEIVACFEVSGATISHHLSILRNADLVLVDRKGKHMIYEINTSVFDEIISWIISIKGGNKDEIMEE